MPLQTSWYDDQKTLIRCEGQGKWTWDEFHIALDEITIMMKSVEHRVDLINVARHDSKMPAGSPQPHFKRATKVFPANAGLIVLVVKSSVPRAMVSLFSRVPGNSMESLRVAGTIEEACSIIEADRVKSGSAATPIPS